MSKKVEERLSTLSKDVENLKQNKTKNPQTKYLDIKLSSEIFNTHKPHLYGTNNELNITDNIKEPGNSAAIQNETEGIKKNESKNKQYQ